jgi:hypothetical protein
MNMAAALAVMLAVFGVAAPLMSQSLRTERFGDDPASGASHPRLWEVSQTSRLKVPPIPSWSAEFAEIDEEESDEEEEGQAPVATSGDMLRLLGSPHPSNTPERPDSPPSPPAPLFLLCGHMLC